MFFTGGAVRRDFAVMGGVLEQQLVLAASHDDPVVRRDALYVARAQLQQFVVQANLAIEGLEKSQSVEPPTVRYPYRDD